MDSAIGHLGVGGVVLIRLFGSPEKNKRKEGRRSHLFFYAAHQTNRAQRAAFLLGFSRGGSFFPTPTAQKEKKRGALSSRLVFCDFSGGNFFVY